jgi:muramidase (phage lysozyme)
MKYQNLLVYSILAIGLLSIPSLLDSIHAQTNATQQNQTAASGQNQTAASGQNQTAASGQNQTGGQQGQNQTMSPDTQALMAFDIPEIKDNIMDAKEALANGNTEEALTAITDVENQLLTVQPQPKFTEDFQKIKDSIAQADLSKALDDISNVQTELLKAETEVFKAGLPTPQQMMQQGTGDGDGEDGDGEDGDGEDGDGGN